MKNPLKTKKRLSFRLSPRELEILRCISRGLPSKIIACELFITVSTVSWHRASLLQKFDAKNTIELLAKCKDFL